MSSSAADLDVMDRSGRARRLALALGVGIVMAIIAFVVARGLAKPDSIPHDGVGFQSQPFYYAWQFVYATAGLVGAAAMSITLVIAKRRARR